MPPTRPTTSAFAALLDTYRAVNGEHLDATDLADDLHDASVELGQTLDPLVRVGVLLDELALEAKHYRGGPE